MDIHVHKALVSHLGKALVGLQKLDELNTNGLLLGLKTIMRSLSSSESDYKLS